MKTLKLTFKRGGTLYAVLDEEKSPITSSIIWECLPFTSTVTHSRWSGREVNFGLEMGSKPPRENQSVYTSAGDLCYWRDWRLGEQGNSTHVLAIYYGPEKARSHMGEEPVNIIGSLSSDCAKELRGIGERIWKEGFEQVYVEQAN